ncbi:MAG: MYXO-CTERM domain-containing protein [Myxococcota bacterium]|jgi:MYXO-CTERM domain-containing protein
MIHLLTAAALANTWGPTLDGFVSTPRADAPVDGIPVYVADIPVTLTLEADGGPPAPLTTAPIGDSGFMHGVHPPDGGWPVGVPLVVRITESGAYPTAAGDDAVLELAFTATADPALATATPVPRAPVAGEWIPDSDYPWGCCADVRAVDLTVDIPGADPWAVAQLVADDGETVSSEPVRAGIALLSWVQWVDEGAHRACVDVIAYGAAGDASAPIEVCLDLPDGATDSGRAVDDSKDGCGCDVGPNPASWSALMLLLVLVGRRAR